MTRLSNSGKHSAAAGMGDIMQDGRNQLLADDQHDGEEDAEFAEQDSHRARNIGGTQQSDITTALVGIAGAFIGFHIGVVLELLPLPLMQYVLAIIGAFVVLWLWRGR